MSLTMKKVSIPVLMFMMFQSASCMTNAEFGRASSALAEGDKYEVLYRVAPNDSTYGGRFTTLTEKVDDVTPGGWTNDTNFRNELLDKLFDCTKGVIDDTSVQNAITGVIKEEFPRSEWWAKDAARKSSLISIADLIKDVFAQNMNLDAQKQGISDILQQTWISLTLDVNKKDMGNNDKTELEYVFENLDAGKDEEGIATDLEEALKEVLHKRLKSISQTDATNAKKTEVLNYLEKFLNVFLYRSKDDPKAASDIDTSYDTIITKFYEKNENKTRENIEGWLCAAVARQIEEFLRNTIETVTESNNAVLTRRTNLVKALDNAADDAALKDAVNSSIGLTAQKVTNVATALNNIKGN